MTTIVLEQLAVMEESGDAVKGQGTWDDIAKQHPDPTARATLPEVHPSGEAWTKEKEEEFFIKL